jgi:hypothetical protein
MIVEVEGTVTATFGRAGAPSLSARFFAARKSRLSIMADFGA